nr:MAG TPA: hypothetical protein [Caudoviricetes sp.]
MQGLFLSQTNASGFPSSQESKGWVDVCSDNIISL